MRVLVIKRGALRLVDQELQSVNDPTTQKPRTGAASNAERLEHKGYLPLFVAANLVTPGGATSLRPRLRRQFRCQSLQKRSAFLERPARCICDIFTPALALHRKRIEKG